MKRTMVMSFFAVLAVSTATAQTFDLDWYTIDGGGDMWTVGGNFELSGTVGQPDAGVVLTGGTWQLTGGFWVVALVPAGRPGDLNCDGAVNFADITPFVLALSNADEYKRQFPNCNINNADINGDGKINFADINPFVALLSGGQ